LRKSTDWFKSWLPTKEQLIKNRWLYFLRRKMHKAHLWDFGQSAVVRAVMIGIFMCMMPMPFQMIPAAILAFVFRANLILSVGLVWISNPFTMVPMWYVAYLLGCSLWGEVPLFQQENLTWSEMFLHSYAIYLPMLTGGIVIGLVAGSTSALIVWLIYKLKDYLRRSV
jgi:uncharacterized protein (DUF2062 family)